MKIATLLGTLLSVFTLSAFAEPAELPLGKQLDTLAVGCAKKAESEEYVRLMDESEEKAMKYFNSPDTTCMSVPAKLKLEAVDSTHKLKTGVTILIVKGTAYGVYGPTGYLGFGTPETVYFIIGDETDVEKPKKSTPRGDSSA